MYIYIYLSLYIYIQNAIRRISLRVFEHVHHLDLGFHLSRHAGSVSRVLTLNP